MTEVEEWERLLSCKTFRCCGQKEIGAEGISYLISSNDIEKPSRIVYKVGGRDMILV
jgi:hypothetical protein